MTVYAEIRTKTLKLALYSEKLKKVRSFIFQDHKFKQESRSCTFWLQHPVHVPPYITCPHSCHSRWSPETGDSEEFRYHLMSKEHWPPWQNYILNDHYMFNFVPKMIFGESTVSWNGDLWAPDGQRIWAQIKVKTNIAKFWNLRHRFSGSLGSVKPKNVHQNQESRDLRQKNIAAEVKN